MGSRFYQIITLVINVLSVVHGATDPGGLRILVNGQGNIRSSEPKKNLFMQNSSIREKNSSLRLLQVTDDSAGQTQGNIGPMLPTELVIVDESEKVLVCGARCISNAGGLAFLAQNYTMAFYERTLLGNKNKIAIFARVIVNKTICSTAPEPNADGTPATLVTKNSV